MSLIIFVAILWAIYRAGYWYIAGGILLLLHNALTLTAACLTGGFITFFYNHELIRQIHLTPSITSAIADSDYLWLIFFIPVTAPLDVILWVLHVTIFQGSIVMRALVAFALYYIVIADYKYILFIRRVGKATTAEKGAE